MPMLTWLPLAPRNFLLLFLSGHLPILPAIHTGTNVGTGFHYISHCLRCLPCTSGTLLTSNADTITWNFYGKFSRSLFPACILILSRMDTNIMIGQYFPCTLPTIYLAPLHYDRRKTNLVWNMSCSRLTTAP